MGENESCNTLEKIKNKEEESENGRKADTSQ
jgi:hypothetical protein